jgi:hypothetical protein
MNAWRADPLVWGHGPRVFEVFLEPTCPFSVKAFGNLDDLLDQAGEDRITVNVRLQSQPWHMYSAVIVRCILAASTLEGGKTAAKSVMATWAEAAATVKATPPYQCRTCRCRRELIAAYNDVWCWRAISASVWRGRLRAGTATKGRLSPEVLRAAAVPPTPPILLTGYPPVNPQPCAAELARSPARANRRAWGRARWSQPPATTVLPIKGCPPRKPPPTGQRP